MRPQQRRQRRLLRVHRRGHPLRLPRQPSPAGNNSRLGELAINDGLVAITDLQDRKPRTVYNNINLKLTDFAPNTPFNLDASVHLPGSGSQEVQLQGKGGPLSHTNPASTPFKGTLELKGVEIGELQKFLQTPALVNTDGVLSGHTDIASANGNLSASGQMNLDKPKLHGIDVGISDQRGLRRQRRPG